MTTRTGVRPVTERPQFERLALVLQGGGALGAYQGGVYQALAEADLHPNWIGGISIGAINAAIIAGNPPKERVARLRAFWERITAPPPWMPSIGTSMLGALEFGSDFLHTLVNQTQACTTLMNGAPGFFFRGRSLPFSAPRISRPTASTMSVRYGRRWRSWWISTASMRRRPASPSEP